MKAICMILSFLVFSGFTVNAQSLQLMTLSGNPVPNGGTITTFEPYTDTLAEVITFLIIRNVSSSNLNVKAVRTIKSLSAPQTSNFCFAGLCYADTTNVSVVPAPIAANTNDTSFSNHVKPNNAKGSSIVYYKFFNIKNPSDTVSCYFQTELWPSGVSGLAGSSPSLGNAWPNPAVTSFTVAYDPGASVSVRLILRNILGITVKEMLLAPGAGKAEIHVSDLPAGIYMYSLEADGKNYGTRKLLVNH